MPLKFRGTNLSIWFTPLMYTAGAIICGFAVPRVSYVLWPGLSSTVSVSAAIGIYSAVASGMLALTAIVFSLIFVTVQFSATAYSPRLVLWVANDPFVPHAMGVFTATFLYALSALAWVDRYGSGRVPLGGAVIVILLLIVSIIMFVGLIQRVHKLQVTQMLSFAGDHGREVIHRFYPPIDTLPVGSVGPLSLPALRHSSTMDAQGRFRESTSLLWSELPVPLGVSLKSAQPLAMLYWSRIQSFEFTVAVVRFRKEP